MANKIETQVDCPLCGETHHTRSRITITTHAKDAHGLEPIEIYKLYKKIDKFICKLCGDEHSRFISFCKGHIEFCSHSCAQKFARADRVLNNPQAELAFRQKLSVSIALDWKLNDQTERLTNIIKSTSFAYNDDYSQEVFSEEFHDQSDKYIESVLACGLPVNYPVLPDSSIDVEFCNDLNAILRRV
jgi:hypothetical protein